MNTELKATSCETGLTLTEGKTVVLKAAPAGTNLVGIMKRNVVDGEMVGIMLTKQEAFELVYWMKKNGLV